MSNPVFDAQLALLAAEAVRRGYLDEALQRLSNAKAATTLDQAIERIDAVSEMLAKLDRVMRMPVIRPEAK